MRYLLLAAVAALMLVACSKKAPEVAPAGSSVLTESDIAPADSVAQPEAPLHFAKTVWRDVRMLQKPASAAVEYDIRYADDGPKVLVDNINNWVTGRFEILGAFSPAELPGAVRKWAEEALAEDAAEVADCIDPEGDNSYLQYTRTYKIRVEHSTPEYVTLSCQFYRYCGGAHGGTRMDYATFRLSDGRQMDWDLLAGMPRPELMRTIRKGLMDYFEVKTDAELDNALLLLNGDPLPLPIMPPFLTKKGVEVIYQQYEIAPYAAGMPSCVVSPKPVLGKSASLAP